MVENGTIVERTEDPDLALKPGVIFVGPCDRVVEFISRAVPGNPMIMDVPAGAGTKSNGW